MANSKELSQLAGVITVDGGVVTVDGKISVTDGTDASHVLTKSQIEALIQTVDQLSEMSGTTDDITEGSTNLYYTDARVDANIATKTTDNLTEGSTNLYYTDTRVRAALSVTDSGGDGSLVYDSGTGVITYTGPSATEVRAHFSAGTGVDITDGVVSIGQPVATTDSVEFADLTIGSANLIYNDGFLEYNAEGGTVPIKIGATQLLKVYNNTGSAFTKGQIVRGVGSQGNVVAVELAKADAESTSASTLGMVAEPIAVGAEGYIIVGGIINGLDTSLLSGGAIYLSSTTAGAFTQTKPLAPNHLVVLGAVERVHESQGSIYIKVDNGYELNELHDVYYTTPNNNDLLKWVAAESRWEVGTLSTTEVSEGDNLYYTDARVQTKLGNISGDIIPDTNVTYDIGSSAYRFRDLYLSGTSIYLGTLKLSDDSGTFSVTDGSSNSIPVSLAANDTDDLAEGSTNLYYTDARAQAAISTDATLSYASGVVSMPNSGVTAGSYGSGSQVPVITIDNQGRVTSASVSNVAGVSNFTYTSGTNTYTITTSAGTSFTASGDLTSFDTNDLTEGTTNLYFTASRARASISVTDAGGDGSLTYDAGTGEIAYTGPSASEVRAHFSAGTGVDITNGVISIGQSVGSSDAPTFAALKLTPTSTAPTYAEGTMWYDSASKTVSIQGATSTFPVVVGEREWVRCRNSSGATIPKGTPVYVTGVHISGDPIHGHHPTIAPADASDSEKYEVIGLAGDDIANAAHGYVVVRGWIQNIDTSHLTEGTRVHLGFASPGTIIDNAPSYPNYPMDLGICLTSDATIGSIYVDIVQHSFEGLRVSGNGRISGDLTVAGDLSVLGTQTIANTNAIAIGSPFNYLNSGDTIGEANTVFTGSGLDDAYFAGYYEGATSKTFYVAIDGVGTGTGGVDTFKWSYNSDMSSPQATAVDITGLNQVLADNIKIHFEATVGHTSGDKWSGGVAPVNVDTGWASNRNTGTTGVGYTHVGFFFDVSSEKFRMFDTYDPEPEGTINISDASYHTGTLVANIEGNVTGNVTGNVSGNASSATTAGKWDTARTITLGGDLSGNVSIDGSANVTLTATVAANSVALGTDTTGNYMVGVTAGTGISVSHTASEGSTATISHSDTSTVANLTAASRTYISGITFDTFGHVQTITTGTESDQTIGDGTMTVTAGSYLTGGGQLGTANQTGNSSVTLAVDATSANTVSKVVARDASGNFSAGTITAALSGNASTATSAGKWTTARTITLGGDLTGNVSIDGSANVTLTATVAANSVALGTDTTGAYVADVVAGSAITISETANNAESNVVTINHADTSTVANLSSDNANGVVIQDIAFTFDTYGHVQTATVATVDLDGRYFTETEADARYVNVTGDTMTGALTAPTYYSSGTTYYMQPATALSGTTAGSRFNDLRFETLWQGVPANDGPILTYTLTSGGSGYTNGSYTNSVVSGGGVYATFDFTVAGGIVTVATLTERGSGFAAGDTIAIPALGGTGSGGVITVNTVRTVDISLYNTASRIRLGSNDTSLAAGQEIGGIYFNTRDASAGGAGDKAFMIATAEGTSGGGKFEFHTSVNGGSATKAFEIAGNSDTRFYNSAGTFYHSISNAPTANRTLTLPNATGTVALTSDLTPYVRYYQQSTNPGAVADGSEWWDTTNGILYKRIESSWVQLSPSSGIGIYDVNGTKVN